MAPFLDHFQFSILASKSQKANTVFQFMVCESTICLKTCSVQSVFSDLKVPLIVCPYYLIDQEQNIVRIKVYFWRPVDIETPCETYVEK